MSSHHINWWSLGGAHSENPAMGWYMLTFIVFIAGLVYYLRPPLALFFETRSNDIKKAIEEARMAKAESEAKLRECEARLQSLDAEIAQMKSEFMRQGEIERQNLKEAAQLMATQIAKDAQDTIAAEIHHAKLVIKRQLASSVINLAKQNVQQHMNRQLGLREQNAFVLDVGEVKH